MVALRLGGLGTRLEHSNSLNFTCGSIRVPPFDDTMARTTEGKRTSLYDQSAVAWLERITFIKGARRQGCEIVADFLLK
jgi:hypothetical protein